MIGLQSLRENSIIQAGPNLEASNLERGCGHSPCGPSDFVVSGGALQIPPLRSPRFPVEIRGVEEELAPFFTERRTRGPCWCCVTGNRGRDDKGKGGG